MKTMCLVLLASILDTCILLSRVSILDTCIFFKFISIYQSKSQDCPQVYDMSLPISYYWVLDYTLSLWLSDCFHFVSSANLKQPDMASNSLADWLTVRNSQTGRVTGHNLQIATFTARNSEIIRLPTHKLLVRRFANRRLAVRINLCLIWPLPIFLAEIAGSSYFID